MNVHQPSLRLVGSTTSANSAEDRAERFNQAIQNFVESVDRASRGLAAMGQAWERAPMIVAPAPR